ncbi:MAG: hypothetical protein UX80_C0003G0081 [Candidatus Amesbacteria bacterium GW2011_GWA2_47_11b]|uniref:Uncharacterized protein n=1 Tax=Candidatus Amesbacteria bacterium GW2011_GWA2_47_11b TaxID=1618358 RepID=A0A0G1RMQ1_9BACT|nr:MAG: hypothetical protein UX80_C0003G0081 [Candidatus Amesbacteria bacterium GW2011_GWA2_47_11b]
MLTDNYSDGIAGVQTGNDFGVTWANGLDGFGDPRFLQEHGLGMARLVTGSLTIEPGCFEQA